MDQTISFRATAQLAAVVVYCSLGWIAPQAATAQGYVASPGQPAWVGQQPTFQVGPNGAVNLDQQQPYMTAQPVSPFPAATYPPPPNAAQQWGAQPVVQQPAWGAPWAPATNIPAATPYFFLHRTSLFGEFFYVRPRNAEVAYALPAEVALGEFDPAGPVAVIDPEYEPAFRVGGKWAVNDGNSIALQYTKIQSETLSAVAVADDLELLSLVSLPESLLDVLEADRASAMLTIDLDQADVDFRGLWAGCECNNYAYAVNYLAGAQYAVLDQTFRATFVEDDDNESETVATAVNFDGVGMRLGLQGERYFPTSGLFVYGSGISSILFGEFDATYRQESFEDAAADVDGFTSWNAGRVVPVAELELGAGWLGANRHLRLSAGYRVMAWFNVVKTEDWIWAVQNNDYRDLDGTLTFDGLVGRAEWLF